MMKTKTPFLRPFILLCALVLILGGCTGGGNATPEKADNTAAGAQATATNPTGGYIEVSMDTSAYSSMSTIASDENGDIWAAGKRKTDGQWELLCWKDGSSTCESFPLSIEGNASQLSISPDGSIAVLASKPMDFQGMMGGDMRQTNPDTADGADGADSADDETTDGAADESTDGAADENADDAADVDADPKADAPVAAVPGAVNDRTGGSAQSAPGGGQNMMMGFQNESVIYWVSRTGETIKETPISMNNDMLSSFAALDNYETICATARQGLSRLDEQGNSLAAYSTGTVSSFAVQGDTLYVLDGQTRAISFYEIESGNEIKTITGVTETGNNAYLAVRSDGTICVVSSNGIFTVNQDTEQVEQVLDGVNYSMNDPSLSLTSACAGKDNSIIAALSAGDGNGSFMMSTGGMTFNTEDGEDAETTLYAYRWSAELDLSNMKELRIAGLRDSQALRKAISEFQREHPDVRVSLTTYLDANDTESTTTDYIRTINAELLAGDGADVLILDGLPMDNYIKKGILLDLTDALSSIDILPGIREGSVYRDGKLYGLPAAFSFTTLWGSSDLIGSLSGLSDIAALADSLPSSQTALAPRTAEQLLSLFFEANKSQFTDEDGNLQFDTPEFEEFLEALYALYEEPEPDTGNSYALGGRTATGGRMGLDMNEVLEMANQSVALLPLKLTGVNQINTAYSVAGAENSAWMSIPGLTGDSYTYTPSLIAGVNAQSAHTDIAIEFVKTLFSDEVQKMSGSSGLPTSQKVLDQVTEEVKNSEMLTSIRIPNGPALDFTNADEATWDSLRAYCDQVRNPSYADDTLMAFIVEETAKFFDGSKSAKDTAKAVQQRVSAYLAE